MKNALKVSSMPENSRYLGSQKTDAEGIFLEGVRNPAKELGEGEKLAFKKDWMDWPVQGHYSIEFYAVAS